MKIVLLTLLLTVLAPSLWGYQKGIVLGLYSKDPAYSYEQDLAEIKKIGADHVSLVVSWYQKDIRSDTIYPLWKAQGDFETTSDAKLTEVIRQAHRAGLKVLLFPILRIEERREKEWRGSLEPAHRNRWLESYRNFTLHYARLAARSGVEVFSIGSELCTLEGETAYWGTLIGMIRGFYRGELLYSANWDHYRKIGFWKDLDYLALNGYYELTRHDNPKIDEILRTWWDIQNRLADWQEFHRKKIIFTEIGYPSVDGGCSKPWDYTRDAAVDLEEQALCYEAFFLSWNRSSRLGGVYFWNWYGQGGENDRSYTPRGKPAEEVLTRWYTKSSSPGPGQPSYSYPAAGGHRTATSSQARSPSF